MPNGVSCAYFAVKNHETGRKDNNIFREGIAGIQGIRTLNAATALATPVLMAGLAEKSRRRFKEGSLPVKFIDGLSNHMEGIRTNVSSVANTGKKIVYPLIICSGILNTVRSEDKVRTGCSEAGGISVMYLFENAAEQGLNKLQSFCSSHYSNNKAIKVLLPFVKGFAFICASLLGYSLGSEGAKSMVDKLRSNKKGNVDKTDNSKTDNQPNSIFDTMKME